MGNSCKGAFKAKCLVALRQQPGFQYIFRQRFEIEGHAIGLRQNRLLHFGRQRLSSCQRRHKFGTLPTWKTAERQERHVTIVRPHRLEVGSKCDQQQHAHLPDAAHDSRQEVQRGGIQPMGIFHDKQHGGTIGQPL